ncbi:MAG: tRNA lysidine(34) synthetase TilS [Methylocystis sp.]|nr:tRNA lysidine(34) synthetase TilS [Methylocystis sp.]
MGERASDRLDEKLDDALALLAPYPSLLLAVSGGPDSVALMLACAHWRARNAHDIRVATVDHGLRAGSGAEARKVARWSRALGFRHHILRWEDEKPATRLQERAREARYRLLAACAKQVGADAIVVAHHADDQAETILFRLARGSGVAGLAGMTRVGRCGEAALLRPFLDLSKRDLGMVCARAGHDFVRDPSNENTRFARTKLRALAPMLAELGLDRDALLRLGARAAQADAALARCARDLYQRARIASDMGVALNAAAFADAPLELLQRALAQSIAELRPDGAPASSLRLERIERAARRVAAALAARKPTRLTLADILIDCKKDRIQLCPAPQRKNRG